MGEIGAECRKVDNKLFGILFPLRFGELFKSPICYSSFAYLGKGVMVWRLKKDDFDEYSAKEYRKVLEENNLLIGNDGKRDQLEAVIGKEKNVPARFVPMCLGGNRDITKVWSERIRSIQFESESDNPRVWNRMIQFR
jgi:hypothetical protein